jgi:hypothetical protein
MPSNRQARRPSKPFVDAMDLEKLMHLYEVRPRADRKGVDLISDVLPFGGLSRAECNRQRDWLREIPQPHCVS